MSAVIFTAMHNTPHPHPGRRRDGSRTTPYRRHGLRLAATAGTRLRCGQTGNCRDCGNPVEWYHRPDDRPIPLHPQELPTHTVPGECRWHLAAGLAHPGSDNSHWCRIPHAALCPSRAPFTHAPVVSALRRRLAARTRRLIDTGSFTPTVAAAPTPGRPVRPVVQMLGIRYLAAPPVEDIACVARARRTRCGRPLLDAGLPAGTWRLLPTAATGQLALPAGLLMAIYDLADLPSTEQLRWRAQRCRHHGFATAEMTVTDWEPFEPLTHREHIRTRLPGNPSSAIHPDNRPRRTRHH